MRMQAEENKEPYTVGVNGVMQMYGVGRNTALKMGKDSGASFKLGKRLLFKVDTLNAYIDRLAAEYTGAATQE